MANTRRSTLWKVQQGINKDDVIEEFTLYPNDMIYIPKMVESLPNYYRSRCSVSFAIEDDMFNSVEERSDI